MFYPSELVQRLRRRLEADTGAREGIVAAAAAWREMSEEALWDAVFGPTISRAWMVWSDGHCPACGEPVKMYAWEMDPLAEPWKVWCPHCAARFPTNDFEAFYRSGLDAGAVFDPGRADPRLLHNAAHPDRGDPLHRFGVDDGEGYARPGARWRFVGAYLVYGQWKRLIVQGVRRLADAYTATGDAVYARKAGVLLDRVSDLYPDFDFGAQGVVYERRGDRGYVSTWHDACGEAAQLVLAYDQVREAVAADGELVRFLEERARQWRLPTPKTSGRQICDNIETRFLRHTLENRERIQSNFPTTDMTCILIETVLGWPGARQRVYELFDAVLERACAVDGLSGEKGLAGYATIAPRNLVRYLALYARADAGFLERMLARHPRLRDMYRFHIDTWCAGRYYPNAGDTGAFARPQESYAGATFDVDAGEPLLPSAFSFFMELYRATGDEAFAQVLYGANGSAVEGLPHDLLEPDPAAFQRQVAGIIDRAGPTPCVGSVNKEAWHLAILRHPAGDGPIAWVDGDSGEPSGLYAHRMDPRVRGRGGHSHADGLNLGLYYRGLDLMPDFGYPPVSFGGWDAPQAEWYKMTAAHCTLVVDGLEQATAGAATTLWVVGQGARAVRLSAPGLIEGRQCERTVLMVDTGPRDGYLVDVLRAVGGYDHARFSHSHFSSLETSGLQLAAGEEYGYGTLMRDFRTDAAPAPGWWADWAAEDRYGLAAAGAALHLRSTELTRDASASVCEGWVAEGYYGDNREAWIPRLLVRRRAERAPLASTFAAVLEPYDGEPLAESVARLDLQTPGGGACGDHQVAVEVGLADGRRDLVIAADAADPLELGRPAGAGQGLVQPAWDVEVSGELAVVRLDSSEQPERLILANGPRLRAGQVELTRPAEPGFAEVELAAGGARLVGGDGAGVELVAGGRQIDLG